MKNNASKISFDIRIATNERYPRATTESQCSAHLTLTLQLKKEKKKNCLEQFSKCIVRDTFKIFQTKSNDVIIAVKIIHPVHQFLSSKKHLKNAQPWLLTDKKSSSKNILKGAEQETHDRGIIPFLCVKTKSAPRAFRAD